MVSLLYPSTRLKLGAALLASIWIASTVSDAPFTLANAAVTAIIGGLLATIWYFVMRRRNRRGPAFSSAAKKARRFSGPALIFVIVFVVALLGNRIEPLIPPGQWHRLLSNLLIVAAWPTLIWPLHTLGMRILVNNDANGATMNPTIGLKWSAVFFTVFWTAGMLLWSGMFNPASIAITTGGGIVAGTLWYRIMRWMVIGRHGPPRHPDQG